MIIARYDCENDVHWIEILSPQGQLIERRVTKYKGEDVEDTHYGSSSSKPKFNPHKFSNKTDKTRWRLS